MRILIVDHNALDPLHRSLYGALGREEGLEIRLLVPSRWFDNYRWIEWDAGMATPHCEVVPGRVLLASRTHRMIYRSLPRELDSFRPDILYVNSEPENFQTFHAAFMSRRRRPMKFVFSSWRTIDHSRIGYPYRFSRLNALAERYVLRNADHCIAFNEAAREIFTAGGFGAVTVIPPHVDLARFTPEAPAAGDPAHGRMRIGFAGRFVELKGVGTLLRAAASLPFEFTVSLIGEGPAKARWQAQAKDLQIDGRIAWIPAVPRLEMPRHIRAMDVIVLPSWTGKRWKEQFGRILIEAMACGVPVIGSDSGEIPRVIGDAGLIFHERDAGELCDRLLKIHDDPSLREQLIRAGRERAAAHFSVEAVAPLYQRLFTQLARG